MGGKKKSRHSKPAIEEVKSSSDDIAPISEPSQPPAMNTQSSFGSWDEDPFADFSDTPASQPPSALAPPPKDNAISSNEPQLIDFGPPSNPPSNAAGGSEQDIFGWANDSSWGFDDNDNSQNAQNVADPPLVNVYGDSQPRRDSDPRNSSSADLILKQALEESRISALNEDDQLSLALERSKLEN